MDRNCGQKDGREDMRYDEIEEEVVKENEGIERVELNKLSQETKKRQKWLKKGLKEMKR
jgi:hypothetical protein